jgi:hypothetical protein
MSPGTWFVGWEYTNQQKTKTDMRNWWTYAGETWRPLNRSEISDLWYAVARLQELHGNPEDAVMSRRSARWFRGKWR